MLSQFKFFTINALIVFSIIKPQAVHSQIVKIDLVEKHKACSQRVPETGCPHRYMRSANISIHLFKKNKNSRALFYINKAISEAIKADADPSMLYYIKAQELAASNNYAEAVAVMDLAGEDVACQSRYNMAVYCMKAGLFERSAGLFHKVIAEGKTNKLEAHWGLGFVNYKLNQIRESIVEFKEALCYGENREIRMGLVNDYLLINEVDSALDNLQVLVLRHPFDCEANNLLYTLKRNLRGYCKKSSGNFTLPMFYSNSVTDGNRAYQNGDYSGAKNNYNNFSADNKTPYLIGLGNIHLGKHETDLALKYYKIVIESDVDNPFANEGCGLAFFQSQNYDSVLYYLNNAENHGNGYRLSYDGLLIKGLTLLKSGLVSEAMVYFKIAIGQSENNAWAHAGYAIGLAQQSGFPYNDQLKSEANYHFTEAIRSDKGNPTIIFYAGLINYYDYNYNKALEYFETAHKLSNKDPLILNALAMTYTKLGKFILAEQIMKNVLDLSDNNWQFLINTGMTYTEHAAALNSRNIPGCDSLIDIANKYYEMAITMGADTSIALINKANGYVEVKRYQNAKDIYFSIGTTDSLIEAAISNNLGVISALEFDKSTAKQYFLDADNLDSKDRYSAVKRNIWLNNAGWPTARVDKKYTSIIYYYIPCPLFNPSVGTQLNLPFQNIDVKMPDEQTELIKYKFMCDQKTKYKINATPGFRKQRAPHKKKVDACS